jgi:hypothetical protein
MSFGDYEKLCRDYSELCRIHNKISQTQQKEKNMKNKSEDRIMTAQEAYEQSTQISSRDWNVLYKTIQTQIQAAVDGYQRRIRIELSRTNFPFLFGPQNDKFFQMMKEELESLGYKFILFKSDEYAFIKFDLSWDKEENTNE